MTLPNDHEDDVFPTNILPVDKPEPLLKATRRAALSGPLTCSVCGSVATARANVAGRACDGLRSQKPTRRYQGDLARGKSSGLEPKAALTTGRSGEPSYWPPAPSFRGGNVVGQCSAEREREPGHQGAGGQRSLPSHLGGVPEFVSARIREGLSRGEEDDVAPAQLFNAPPGIENSWWPLRVSERAADEFAVRR